MATEAWRLYGEEKEAAEEYWAAAEKAAKAEEELDKARADFAAARKRLLFVQRKITESRGESVK